jgi:tetratricopeptide (TPR) repeat protein
MPDTAPLPYDVFLSYSHRDNQWVRQDLLPKLEANKLAVLIDFRDFEAGAPTIEEIQRAIDESRKTLLVLTDNYLQSEWTTFERYLLQTDDPTNAKRKLIPVRRGACALPRSISYLTYVDLGDPEYQAVEWQKLLRALGSPSTRPAQPTPPLPGPAEVQAATGSARQGLDALLEIIDDPAAQADVATFQAIFGESSRQIEVLAYYKDLHDLLHTLQFKCYNYLAVILRTLELSPDDVSVWDNCVDHEDALQDMLAALSRMISQEALSKRAGPLVTRLPDDLRAVSSAVRLCDGGELKKALAPLRRILATEPTRLNARLTEAARALPLDRLADALARLHETFHRGRVNHETLARFKGGVDAVADLGVTVTSLIEDHDAWQRIDDELRRVDASVVFDITDLLLSWPELRAYTAERCHGQTDEWAVRLQETTEKLDQALAAQDVTRARQFFRQYRSRVDNTFYRVDLELKRLCDELRRIGEPLAALAEIL